MSEYSKEKIKAELHEKYENGEIDDVELEGISVSHFLLLFIPSRPFG